MSRLQDIRRRSRGDLHREMSVSALYFVMPTSDAVECNVRLWLQKAPLSLGSISSFQGSADRLEPEDQIRFDLSEFPPSRMPRYQGVISVAEGEAYRIDHLYPVDRGYQTARVTRLPVAETAGLAVPA